MAKTMVDRVYDFLVSKDGEPVTMAEIAEAFEMGDRDGKERVSEALIRLRRKEVVSRTKAHNVQLWSYYVGMNPADRHFKAIMRSLARSGAVVGLVERRRP